MSIDWDLAACVSHPDEWWFANERHPEEQEAARHICLSCPIMLDCGRHALAREGGLAACHRYGTWGALTPKQRFQLRPKGSTAGKNVLGVAS